MSVRILSPTLAAALSLSILASTAESRGAGPVSGMLGATLGAGASAGTERAAWDGTPAALNPGTTGILFHVHRPFGIGELAVLEAGAYLDGRNTGASAAWSQMEVEDLYRETALELRLARRVIGEKRGLAGTWDMGAGWTWERRMAAGRRPETDWSQSLGILWRPLPRLATGFMARGIPLGEGTLGDWEDQGAILQWGVEAGAGPASEGSGGKAHPSGPEQALRFDLRKTGSAGWRTMASWSLRPHPSLEATAGLSSAPFQFSLGLRAAWGGWSIHHALRHHRFLGATRLSSLAWNSSPGD